ncbi:MAG TPA: hypothetical protein VMO17_17260, partial [Terriglobia bacterium]|nr:hypothetical protein [Terriglobia bacterium]
SNHSVPPGVRHHGEFDASPLDVEDRVRRVALKEDDPAVRVLQPGAGSTLGVRVSRELTGAPAVAFTAASPFEGAWGIGVSLWLRSAISNV